MKTSIKKCINCLGLVVALTAILFCATGCAWLLTGGTTSRQSPDPLAGWKVDFGHRPSQAIEKDYHDYIQKIPTKEKEFVGSVEFLENGLGQHAIDIKTGANGRWWRHVLIYDKSGKRIKVIVYKTGGYRS